MLIDDSDLQKTIKYHIEASAYFHHTDIKEWDTKPDASKIMTNLKTHFINAYNYIEDKKDVTAKQTGFAGNVMDVGMGNGGGVGGEQWDACLNN